MRALLAALWLLIAAPAFAQTATVIEPGYDKNAAIEELYARLKRAPNEMATQDAARELWRHWYMTPDARSADLMNKALRAMGGYNFAGALDHLDELTTLYPDYVEGWNQRGHAHFLRRDWPKAIADCEKTVAMNPRHLGCLTGLAIIHIRYVKDFEKGRAALDRAIEIAPYIPERSLLREIPEG